MVFDKEATFEEAVITVLKQHGWDDAEGVLRYPTEQVLIDNWAKILFQNNAGIDRLNGCPLTQGEMAQVIEQIETLKTPLALNGFINGKTIAITRDNPDDALHLGKEVSLKIYDRQGDRSRPESLPDSSAAGLSCEEQDPKRPSWRPVPAHQRHAGHPYRAQAQRHPLSARPLVKSRSMPTRACSRDSSA